MTLQELAAKFIRLRLGDPEANWPKGRPHFADSTLEEASGIIFLCPKCFEANHGPIGTHSVICYFAGRVPDWLEPGPGRWYPAGTGLADLTFVGPGAVSVQLNGGCNWHGFVREGRAE